MSRRLLAIFCCLCFLVGTGFAGDPPAANSGSDSSSATRDATSADVSGIPKHHRYFFSILAGGALGAGIGALLPPGSGKSATKGMLIGGSLASLFYLSSHRNEASKNRPLEWIATNAVLGGGIGWSVCNCGIGFPVGLLIGGGFTGVVQAIEPRHHQTLSKYTGATPSGAQSQTPPPQQQQPPPPNPPPQTNPPPDTNPPQTPPPSQPPQANASPDDPSAPPQTQADVLPDSPQPKVDRDPPQDQL